MPKRKFAGANKELLFLEAKKYNSRTSFFRGSRSAYKECLRQDIMDEACIHTVKFNKFNGNHGNCKLLNEELILLAKNFIQKSHFKEAHPSCYKAIRTRGLASLAYSHMPPTGNRYFRKIYVFEFSDNSAYIGLSYNPEKRYKDHMRDNPLLIEKSIANDCNFKILTELLPAKIAQEKEIFFIEHYKKLGWITLNKARGGSLGPNFQKWNKIKCAELALYFTNRSSFSKSSPGAYNSARSNGWLDEICSHMGGKITEKWEDIELADIAASCSSRYDFKKKKPGAYKAALKRGILNQICAHMPKDCRILPRKDRPSKT